MITLQVLSDFTPAERAKLYNASVQVNKCLADPAFIAELSSAEFDDTDDSTAAIVAKLTAPINVNRLFCENMSWWATHIARTIAAESPDGSVTFNRAFFSKQSIPSLANTLFHEACHVAGYSHQSSRDYLSVPYQAGNMLQDYLERIS